MKEDARLFLVIVTMVALLIGAMSLMGRESQPAGCRDDWRACKDVDELVKLHHWTRAQVDCEFAANGLAKYGEPKWPFPSFTRLRHDDDVMTVGHVTLIESDAQFQNIFGAMVHTGVICNYDLDGGKVIDVAILR